MAAPSGLIVGWYGNHASIPSGWSRVTALDSKIPKGGASAGSTGGADTHTHPGASHSHTDTHTHAGINSGQASGGTSITTAGSGGSSLQTHVHALTFGATSAGANGTATGTSSSGGNLPDYWGIIFIKSDGSTDIPTDAIMMWPNSTGSIPATWIYADGTSPSKDLRSLYLRGAAAAANADAAKTAASSHTHTNSHTHAGQSHAHTGTVGTSNGDINNAQTGGTTASVSSLTHAGHAGHSWNTATAQLDSDATASTAQTPDPSHIKLHHIWRTTSTDVYARGLIGMWDGSAASIPVRWHACDGTLGTLDLSNTFIKGSAADGDQGTTGGTATHTHSISHTHSIAAHTHTNAAGLGAGSNVTRRTGAGQNAGIVSHTHTAGTTGAASNSTSTDAQSLDANTSNDPAYSTMIFIQRIATAPPPFQQRGYHLTTVRR